MNVDNHRRRDRVEARRQRQIAEIASLVSSGDTDRANGLAIEHLAEFPDDRGLPNLASLRRLERHAHHTVHKSDAPR